MKLSKTILLSFLLCLVSTTTMYAWHSSLYPANWTPGYADEQGRFLHDFSYAGYMKGEVPIPKTVGRNIIVDVTKPPYNADNTGVEDATDAIQQAINYVGFSGGGMVFLPAGTYRVGPRSGNNALTITYSNIILRGAGAGKTFIYCDVENMRSKRIINITPSGVNWDRGEDGKTYTIEQDVPDLPTNQIYLNEVGDLKVGDWVILRSDRSTAWIAEHNMQGFWAANTTHGPTFYRQITAVDADNRTITIDIPTRYALKKRDNARVYKVTPKMSNVGLENFSIGNKMNPATLGWGEEDYNASSSNGGYQVHSAFLIGMSYCVDSWVKNVSSYQPVVNTQKIHMSSNGLDINKCRSLTIENCEFSYPQYEGGGGNGYGWNICSQECLIINCKSLSSRHAYSFKYAYSNGNVILNFYSGDNPKYASDFHMYLSMSNLIDNQAVDGDFIESVVRPYGGTAGNYHGHASTQTVFWNTNGIAYKGNNFIVDSRQYGHGYVIGTKGAATGVRTTSTVFNTAYGTVDTAPEDFTEGIGNGSSLVPQSLYYDQLSKRLNKDICVPVTAILHDGNLPENTLDGDLSTYWAADGTQMRIDFCLGEEIQSVSAIKIAFHEGDKRQSRFDIFYSENGVNWRVVKAGNTSSGSTADFETFEFSQPIDAKKIRLIGKDYRMAISEVKFDLATTSTPLVETDSRNKLFSVYPNPMINSELNIELSRELDSELVVDIMDTLGRSVFMTKALADNKKITINTNLTAGTYIVKVGNDIIQSAGLLVVK